jgi:predicted CoA-binding protein
MDETHEIDVEALIAEIERYLDVVDVFRGEGYEPRWCDDCAGSPGANN